MTKRDVQVRRIPGMEDGFEVDVKHVYKETPWRTELVNSIIEETKTIDNVNLVTLWQFAKAFANKSEKERAIYKAISNKGGLDKMTAADMVGIGQKLELTGAEMERYFFPNFEAN